MRALGLELVDTLGRGPVSMHTRISAVPAPPAALLLIAATALVATAARRRRR